ncbi:MAG: hypothetical protein ACUVUG_07620 [Candidatus Aminicenantia bacterium]
MRKPPKRISVKVSEKAFIKIKDENGKEIVSEKLIIKGTRDCILWILG